MRTLSKRVQEAWHAPVVARNFPASGPMGLPLARRPRLAKLNLRMALATAPLPLEGVAAIKALARQPWPDESLKQFWPKAWYQPVSAPEEADLALRFTLSQPVTAAIPPGDIRLFRRALEIAHAFSPLNDGEMRRLRRLSEGLTPLFPLP